ncbi:hypothetical protein RD055328_08420 [Companilactobacillus sp. RD055328]|uniref:hypothetical protein n=1 Tax=Companilactobacillus sp. RD055328 TaxID=2916634 RepID=UPI001FC884B3|nr:hypothetical protein [Companilactobacillus sp. RD055328]GKQ42919.1 hypothetical protein RD055328_08420 [Companilactobacillus sp. RD055328]
MNKETVELIMKYRETFGVGFPTFAVGNDEVEIIKEIKKAIKNKKKFEPKQPNGVLW